MNLILIDSYANQQNLPVDDRRSAHIREVLLKQGSGKLYVGVPDGLMGLANASVLQNGEIRLEIEWQKEKNKGSGGYPLILLVGMSRPQTCRKILREAACLGLYELVFFRSEKGEAAYASSSLWRNGEWERQLMDGVEQAFDTHVPKVHHADDLDGAVSRYEDSDCIRVALDNYEASIPLSELPKTNKPVLMVAGSERGLSGKERELLREKGFVLAHMGSKVFRTETAIVAGCGIISAIQGWY